MAHSRLNIFCNGEGHNAAFWVEGGMETHNEPQVLVPVDEGKITKMGVSQPEIILKKFWLTHGSIQSKAFKMSSRVFVP